MPISSQFFGWICSTNKRVFLEGVLIEEGEWIDEAVCEAENKQYVGFKPPTQPRFRGSPQLSTRIRRIMYAVSSVQGGRYVRYVGLCETGFRNLGPLRSNKSPTCFTGGLAHQ